MYLKNERLYLNDDVNNFYIINFLNNNEQSLICAIFKFFLYFRKFFIVIM